MSTQNYNLIVVIGATASGKTRLGVELAKHTQGEVISGDSRQVYTGLDIGSGKDLAEYGDVPYHLLDIVDPSEEYNAFRFQRDFATAFTDITARGKQPLLVGGTGLYIDAVVSGYEFAQVDKDLALRAELDDMPLEAVQNMLLALKPEQHNDTDMTVRPRLYRAIEIAKHEKSGIIDDFKMPNINPIYFGIKWDRKVLRERITLRLKERLETGMIEEVEELLEQGISHEKLELFGLEYRFVSQYIRGELAYDEMFQKLNTAIHQYAKRQDTWFRRIERRGDKIHWLEGTDDVITQAKAILAQTVVS